ncbi:hypothetical protein E3E11_03265 [Oecophyllibacter saccharovorans]|uniref:hypothetical protein n=1 Tax=Oecophyllibacter saccharovorans TaxID=2558360 RepID=UPI001141467A|nr:hypothetical protein [Oecophyllibacter saccharovorans]QDH15047.1 hypothetical protein E3E11_03265 [Oecophyllibacter saccharovorans]
MFQVMSVHASVPSPLAAPSHRQQGWRLLAGLLFVTALLGPGWGAVSHAASAPAGSLAEGGVTMLARGGQWVALQQAAGGRVGQCAAFAMSQDGETAPLMVHADANGLELRTGSADWNFPEPRSGQPPATLTITAGASPGQGFPQSFPMFYGDSHSLGAPVTAPQMQGLLQGLHLAGSGPDHSVTLHLSGMASGSNAPLHDLPVSLQGADPVLNAFATCTRQAGFAALQPPA